MDETIFVLINKVDDTVEAYRNHDEAVAAAAALVTVWIGRENIPEWCASNDDLIGFYIHDVADIPNAINVYPTTLN